MTLIIAEIGHNFNGDMSICKELIHQAKECGADIAKFQLYDMERLFKPDFEFYRELKRGQVSHEQWLEIVAECRKTGIEFLASVFHVDRIQWCEEVGMKRYKIASRSIYDKELIKAVRATGKPIIASLGMFNGSIWDAIKLLGTYGISYLYCVAKYPTPLKEVHLSEVDFNNYDGFSDHTTGIEAAVVAISRGARIIEKHFTLDKNMDGPDHKGSMEPKELKELVRFSRDIGVIL